MVGLVRELHDHVAVLGVPQLAQGGRDDVPVHLHLAQPVVLVVQDHGQEVVPLVGLSASSSPADPHGGMRTVVTPFGFEEGLAQLGDAVAAVGLQAPHQFLGAPPKENVVVGAVAHERLPLVEAPGRRAPPDQLVEEGSSAGGLPVRPGEKELLGVLETQELRALRGGVRGDARLHGPPRCCAQDLDIFYYPPPRQRRSSERVQKGHCALGGSACCSITSVTSASTPHWVLISQTWRSSTWTLHRQDWRSHFCTRSSSASGPEPHSLPAHFQFEELRAACAGLDSAGHPLLHLRWFEGLAEDAGVVLRVLRQRLGHQPLRFAEEGLGGLVGLQAQGDAHRLGVSITGGVEEHL